jgi:hypothetical protein
VGAPRQYPGPPVVPSLALCPCLSCAGPSVSVSLHLCRARAHPRLRCHSRPPARCHPRPSARCRPRPSARCRPQPSARCRPQPSAPMRHPRPCPRGPLTACWARARQHTPPAALARRWRALRRQPPQRRCRECSPAYEAYSRWRGRAPTATGSLPGLPTQLDPLRGTAAHPSRLPGLSLLRTPCSSRTRCGALWAAPWCRASACRSGARCLVAVAAAVLGKCRDRRLPTLGHPAVPDGAA